MGVLHPFSAASKPIQDWDALPSRPLPFAATLLSSETTSKSPTLSSPIKPPRPRRYTYEESDDLGELLNQRCSSPTSPKDLAGRGISSPSTLRTAVGSDEWMQMKVAHCVDNAKCDLELSDFGLTQLSTKISDLRDLVTLSNAQSPPSSPAATTRPVPHYTPSPRLTTAGPDLPMRRLTTLSDRSFSRTQSAPASASLFSNLSASGAPRLTPGGLSLLPSPNIASERIGATANSRRTFERSTSGVVDFSKKGVPNIAIYASHNLLTSLPSALFEIRYLTVLSLRNNKLSTIPAAIGELVNLKELNISNNKIEYLPSTILSLSLDQFSAHNNNFIMPEVTRSKGTSTLSSLATRVLSPTRQLLQGMVRTDVGGVSTPGEQQARADTVPSLSSLCLSVLLSPRSPQNRPPLLAYDWEGTQRGGAHPLLDAAVLREFMPCLPLADVRRVLQAVKSACTTGVQHPWRRGSLATRADPFPRSHLVPLPDDASANPYYNPCPSPRHQAAQSTSSAMDTPSRRLFLHAAEERFEWVTICGHDNLPIRWLGCSPGCLAFLDTEDDISLQALNFVEEDEFVS